MLAALDIKKGAVVADIGAGVGIASGGWRKSSVPRARSSAKISSRNDDEENIDDRKLKNVEMVLDLTDPPLPNNTLDLVLMVDVYYEFSDPSR
jgi:hypothetical protein